MRMNRRELATGALSLAAGTALSSFAAAEDGFVPFEGIDEFAVATDAYIYGYPLVTMEMTRKVITNVPAVEGTRGPMG